MYGFFLKGLNNGIFLFFFIVVFYFNLIFKNKFCIVLYKSVFIFLWIFLYLYVFIIFFMC